MKRQISLVKVILLAFFSCSVCLPLDHSCYENVASSIKSAEVATASFGHGFRSSPGFPAWVGMRTVSDKGCPCLACLWSQTLLLQKVISGFGIPQLIPSDAVLPKSPGVLITVSYDVTCRRGPPASSIS